MGRFLAPVPGYKCSEPNFCDGFGSIFLTSEGLTKWAYKVHFNVLLITFWKTV